MFLFLGARYFFSVFGIGNNVTEVQILKNKIVWKLWQRDKTYSKHGSTNIGATIIFPFISFWIEYETTSFIDVNSV